MSSGMNTEDPPPLPPPDYRPQSTADFSQQNMPPIRGLIVDPKYPPTAAEATAIWEAKDAATRKNPDSDPNANPDLLGRVGKDIRRSSGTSQILNTAAAPTTAEIANTMPGGTFHTAGGQKVITEDPTVIDALKTIKPDDWRAFHKQPCVREAGLQGLGVSFVILGLAFVTGRKMNKAANWAVGGGLGTMAVGYQYCQIQRKREREGMRLAVQIVEEKKEEKAKLAEERREKWRQMREEKKLKEEAEEAERKRRERRWWNVWQGRGGREG